MPVTNDRQSTEAEMVGRGVSPGVSTIAGANAGEAAAGSGGGNAGSETTGLGAGCAGENTISDGGLERAEVKAPTKGEKGGATGMVNVSRCTISGMDSEATNTTVQAVMCACGLRTRSSVKPSQTTPPSARHRSADSTSS